MEHLEVKIHKAKPRQHSEVRNEVRLGRRIPKINIASAILASLVTIWTTHGGSFVIIVIPATVTSSLIY